MGRLHQRRMVIACFRVLPPKTCQSRWLTWYKWSVSLADVYSVHRERLAATNRATKKGGRSRPGVRSVQVPRQHERRTQVEKLPVPVVDAAVGLWSTALVPDGHHTLEVVAIEDVTLFLGGQRFIGYEAPFHDSLDLHKFHRCCRPRCRSLLQKLPMFLRFFHEVPRDIAARVIRSPTRGMTPAPFYHGVDLAAHPDIGANYASHTNALLLYE